MPIIKPRGFLHGDRIAKLSDEARLYWPFVYAGSNGYGRFLLNYEEILRRCFSQFREKPSQDLVRRILVEYRAAHLLFIYVAPNGQSWGAWDSAASQQYYSRDDEQSPAPPEPEFSSWKKAYQQQKAHPEPSGQNDALGAEFAQESRASITNPEDLCENQNFYKTLPSIHQTSLHQKTSETSITSGGLGGGRDVPHDLKEPDDRWPELVEACTSVQMSHNPSPDSETRKKLWRPLSVVEKAAAIQGISARASGEYADPAFVPSLDSYLRDQKWRYTLRPQPMPRGQPHRKPVASEEAKREERKRLVELAKQQGGFYGNQLRRSG